MLLLSNIKQQEDKVNKATTYCCNDGFHSTSTGQ
jgi:hypothetical protein